jgi:hypothetical protein
MINWIKRLLIGWLIDWLKGKKDSVGKATEQATPVNETQKKTERLLPPRMQ